jgi:hypothetical protein
MLAWPDTILGYLAWGYAIYLAALAPALVRDEILTRRHIAAVERRSAEEACADDAGRTA